MEWTNELILLAPRILPDRKLIEDPDFRGIYTSVEGKLSENQIYILFKPSSSKKYYWLNHYMEQLEHYWNTEFFRADETGLSMLYTFKSNEEDFPNFDFYKSGFLHGYCLYDWVPIFKFWGDRLKEMPRFYEELKLKCDRQLKELQVQLL